MPTNFSYISNNKIIIHYNNFIGIFLACVKLQPFDLCHIISYLNILGLLIIKALVKGCEAVVINIPFAYICVNDSQVSCTCGEFLTGEKSQRLF